MAGLGLGLFRVSDLGLVIGLSKAMATRNYVCVDVILGSPRELDLRLRSSLMAVALMFEQSRLNSRTL